MGKNTESTPGVSARYLFLQCFTLASFCDIFELDLLSGCCCCLILASVCVSVFVDPPDASSFLCFVVCMSAGSVSTEPARISLAGAEGSLVNVDVVNACSTCLKVSHRKYILTTVFIT